MTSHTRVEVHAEKSTRTPLKRVLFLTLAGILAIAYMLVPYYYGSREHENSDAPVPKVLLGTSPLRLPAEDAFREAEEFADHGQIDRGIPELLSVAQYSTNSGLRARALLHAATLMNTANEDADDARQLYEFFLKNYASQPGTDVARFHLAMFALKRNQPALAEFHLMALLRDTPNSNLKTSALFVAGEASQVLRTK